MSRHDTVTAAAVAGPLLRSNYWVL